MSFCLVNHAYICRNVIHSLLIGTKLLLNSILYWQATQTQDNQMRENYTQRNLEITFEYFTPNRHKNWTTHFISSFLFRFGVEMYSQISLCVCVSEPFAKVYVLIVCSSAISTFALVQYTYALKVAGSIVLFRQSFHALQKVSLNFAKSYKRHKQIAV